MPWTDALLSGSWLRLWHKLMESSENYCLISEIIIISNKDFHTCANNMCNNLTNTCNNLEKFMYQLWQIHVTGLQIYGKSCENFNFVCKTYSKGVTRQSNDWIWAWKTFEGQNSRFPPNQDDSEPKRAASTNDRAGSVVQPGHSVSQVDSQAHYFPIQPLPTPVFGLQSILLKAHYISIRTICTCPHLPSSCAVQAVLYPHLALGFFTAGRATRALPMWALATQWSESFLWIEGQPSNCFFLHSLAKQHTADAITDKYKYKSILIYHSL